VAPLKVDPFQERLTVVKFSYNTMKSYIKHIYVPLFTHVKIISKINFYLSLRQKASLNSRSIHFEHITVRNAYGTEKKGIAGVHEITSNSISA
jgi:hypothetical protein